MSFVKEVVCILLNFIKTLSRNLFFWVNNLSNQAFAKINIPFNSIVSKFWGYHDILAESSVLSWAQFEIMNAGLIQSLLRLNAVFFGIVANPSISLEFLSLKWLTH